jgi:apolipoprotein N-acyltransferase
MTPRRRLAILAAYAVATFLAFPHPIGGAVVDLGFAMAWASPLLLLLGIEGLAPRRAARDAFLASLVAHSAILHWIYVVTVRYGHAPPPAGVLGAVALAAYIASFTAAFAWGIAALRVAGLASALVAAILWTALDHLRSAALSGFPWATLGYAQHANPALMALAAFTGVYGLSFVTVLGGAALAGIAGAGRGRAPRGALAALALVATAHVAGLASLAWEPDEDGDTVRVAVLQGNIEQGVKWSRAWFEETLAIYEDLSRRAAAAGAEVIVWPETAVPGALDARDPHAERLSELARQTGASLVLGAVGIDEARDGGPPRFYDSAFLLDAAGRFTDRYDKTHLVPFGEYVPFQDLLGGVLSAVARGIATSGVTAGSQPRSLSLQVPGPGERGLTAAVPICYELLFPDLVRRFVREGAEMLFAITNDAWYGRTGAPYQFLAITALRSAETRVWTARAANTGVSAIIDARGRVRARTPIFERDLLVADVPRRRGGSFYARHGDVFAFACWAALAALAAAGWRRTRRRQ